MFISLNQLLISTSILTNLNKKLFKDYIISLYNKFSNNLANF